MQSDQTMPQVSVRKYYFVSDLHMGGDGQLQHCDYIAEFIAFLKRLENEGPDTELLIVGDTFGFWELTLVRGVEGIVPANVEIGRRRCSP
jgi:UDP-2,3-diacylglucosamine pyrophosphatase LpxH